MRKKIVIGNWKMHKNVHETVNFLDLINSEYVHSDNLDLGIAMPFTSLQKGIEHRGNINIVAQNCYYAHDGAFTGEVSIEMLRDIEVQNVIIGHSERRIIFNEDDELINKKVQSLIHNGLRPIFCCGESTEVFEKGKTKEFVEKQIEVGLKNLNNEEVKNVVIAYEPIWAIGTGVTATPEIAQDTIHFIRQTIARLFSKEASEKILIQYGGSVNTKNIESIISQPDIDGVLVGGASLEVESFLEIIKKVKTYVI